VCLWENSRVSPEAMFSLQENPSKRSYATSPLQAHLYIIPITIQDVVSDEQIGLIQILVLTDRGTGGNRRFRLDPDVGDEGCTAKDIYARQ